MFSLNRIVSIKVFWSDLSIDHGNNVSTQWQLFFHSGADTIKILCYQRSKEVKYDFGVILELVTSNGTVVNRSKFTVIPANVATEKTLRCELITETSTFDKSVIVGQLRAKAIIFTRDPEGPFKYLPGTASMCSGYKVLFNDNKESAEIVVKASDGVELRVHKFPLMARSRTFRSMFGTNMAEKQTEMVHISDFDSKVLNELFRFIYCNEVEGIEEIDVELLKAAKRYEVDELPEVCAKSIICNFHDIEIWNVLKLAHVYELQELLELVASIFLSNYKFYSEQEAWKKEQDFSLKSKVLECIVEQFRELYDIKNTGLFMELGN